MIALPERIEASRRHAQRVINAMRAKLPLQQMAADIVVLAHKRGEPAALRSSSEAEAFVTRIIPDRQNYRWENREIDL